MIQGYKALILSFAVTGNLCAMEPKVMVKFTMLDS